MHYKRIASLAVSYAFPPTVSMSSESDDDCNATVHSPSPDSPVLIPSADDEAALSDHSRATTPARSSVGDDDSDDSHPLSDGDSEDGTQRDGPQQPAQNQGATQEAVADHFKDPHPSPGRPVSLTAVPLQKPKPLRTFYTSFKAMHGVCPNRDVPIKDMFENHIPGSDPSEADYQAFYYYGADTSEDSHLDSHATADTDTDTDPHVRLNKLKQEWRLAVEMVWSESTRCSSIA